MLEHALGARYLGDKVRVLRHVQTKWCSLYKLRKDLLEE